MASNPGIRVLLVDDHQLVREGIRALLRERAGITVVAEAGNGIEALELIKTLQPDIVLSDIAIPGLNGLALTERVTAEAPNVRVIILSMHQTEAHVSQALSAGAAGYLVKGASVLELELAIKSVAVGGTYLTPSVAGKVVEGYVKRGANSSSSRQLLTPRQREILQLLAEGCNTKESAHRLNISVKTVESHRADLMERLGIHDVAGLVRYAIENHLV